MSKKFFITICLAALAATVYGQEYRSSGQRAAEDDLIENKKSGIRVGGTFISPFNSKAGKELKELMARDDIPQFITQYGWQMERHFSTDGRPNGAVTEVLFLAGGMEQGVIIPSVMWLIGYRLDSGFEFGGGPNITMTRGLDGIVDMTPAFTWGAGYGVTAGRLYFPVDVALIKNRGSLRTSLLTGFVF